MKVVIVHGWDGSPEDCWFPWLKEQLEMEVIAPAMPNPEEPKIGEWIGKLKELELGEDTIFVGHSIGCQAILRYLETGRKAKGAVFVGPWMTLDEQTIKEEGEEVVELARPWLETPINWDKVRVSAEKFVCIFSDNDYYVPLKNKKIFEDGLNAEIIVEHGKGHFDEKDGVKELPSVLESVLKISARKD